MPDSDDEHEDDSQDLSNEGYGQGLSQEHRDVQRKHTGSKCGDEDTRTEKYPAQLSRDASEVAAQVLQPPQSTSKKSSLSPRVFKQPPALLDVNQLPESQELSSQVPLHPDDEISHSYVRLSSSLSSLNSLPIQIQPLDDAAATDEQESHNSTPADDLLFQFEQGDWQSGKDLEKLGDRDGFVANSRRSLRQRNPIQLHPYALEGEKYRRTLMARGMRPLRLAQVQDDSRESARDQSSPDSDFEAENESQGLSFQDETQLPQSSQPSTSAGFSALASPERPSTQSGCEDDEFPDIDQLLNRTNDDFVPAGPKRRKTAHGFRYTSRLLSGPSLPRVAQNRNTSTKETETFDIPPSPPATSPPMPVFHAPFTDRRSTYLTSNLASSRAVSLEYAGSEPGATDGNLPTPVTNLVKHTIDLTAEDHTDEDPFSSDSDSSIASPSSEVDQSMQVRRVGKKIRGVLPASWLRLDQQTRQDKNTKATHREHRNLSPIKAALSRRGVAVPKDVTNENSPIATRSNGDGHFILSDSSEDDVSSLPGFVEESATHLFPDSIFSQTDIGSVMEDDRVDAMLPSQKRQTKLLPGITRRKKRSVPTSLFRKGHSGPSFQPKITDHLQKTRSPNSESHRNKRHRIRNNCRSKSIVSQRYQQSSTTKLSILDVVKSYGDNHERLPTFIRIAARNARSRKGLGRHSPTRKFIKLANRADTQDAQSVLRDWREGTLHPHANVTDFDQPLDVRRPLSAISENIRKREAPAVNAESSPVIEAAYLSALPRKVVVSRISTQPGPTRPKEPRSLVAGRNASTIQTKVSKSRIRAPNITTSVARPAQLETSVTEYSTRHPSVTFGSTKKVLDTLYRRAHKGNRARGDVQLARFFGDKSPTSRVDTPIIIDEAQGSRTPLTKKRPVKPVNVRP